MGRSRTPARPCFLVAAVAFASACSLEHWPREPFSSEAWKSREWDERYTLCLDLLDSDVLERTTREHVIELLGEPNGTIRRDRISYLVRKRRLLGFLGEVKVLDVRFGADGRVSEAFVRGT